LFIHQVNSKSFPLISASFGVPSRWAVSCRGSTLTKFFAAFVLLTQIWRLGSKLEGIFNGNLWMIGTGLGSLDFFERVSLKR
jgi:hypothetical protein